MYTGKAITKVPATGSVNQIKFNKVAATHGSDDTVQVLDFEVLPSFSSLKLFTVLFRCKKKKKKKYRKRKYIELH